MRKVTEAGEPFLSVADWELRRNLGTCRAQRAGGFSLHRGGRVALKAETHESPDLLAQNARDRGPAFHEAKTGLREGRDSGICLCASSLATAAQVAEILPGTRKLAGFDRGGHPGGSPYGRSGLFAKHQNPRSGVGDSGRGAGVHFSKAPASERDFHRCATEPSIPRKAPP